MQKQMMRFTGALVSTAIALIVMASGTQALNMKEIEGGKVDVTYIDRGQGQLKEVKAVGIIKAPPGKVWQVLVDYKNYQNFMPKVAKSELQKRSGNFAEAYILLSLPWPFQNTWYINRYTEDANHHIVRWSMIKGSIKHNEGSWSLKPYGKYTLATYSVKVDPGIPIIPQWAIDMATKSTVPSIFDAIKNRVGH